MICSDENGGWNGPKINSLMAQVELSSFSPILYMCVCRNGWRRQGTRKRLQIWRLPNTKSSETFLQCSTPELDYGLQVLATGSHPISYPWQAKHTKPTKPTRHMTICYDYWTVLPCVCLANTDNTQLTNQHINNNIQTQTTTKQHTNNNKQHHTNISHSSKDPGEPLYNHAGHSFFWSSLVTSILHHHRLPILFISQVYQNSMPFLDTVCACFYY